MLLSVADREAVRSALANQNGTATTVTVSEPAVRNGTDVPLGT